MEHITRRCRDRNDGLVWISTKFNLKRELVWRKGESTISNRVNEQVGSSVVGMRMRGQYMMIGVSAMRARPQKNGTLSARGGLNFPTAAVVFRDTCSLASAGSHARFDAVYTQRRSARVAADTNPTGWPYFKPRFIPETPVRSRSFPVCCDR